MAAPGMVALNGTLSGASTLTLGATGSYSGGSIKVDAQTLGSGGAADLSSDFTALNMALNAGGFFHSRTFDLKQGSLTIGNEANGPPVVQAQTVSISVDAGSLTVSGTIDASGSSPGSITLSSIGDLAIDGTGILDAHATVAHVDSNGAPIDAENRASVTLAVADGANGTNLSQTGQNGTLSLAPGATIDVSAASGVTCALGPCGSVTLNAPRVGAANSNDVAISAGGSLTIRGAGSIAVNGFWSYAPADGIIVQTNLANGQPIDPNAIGLDQANLDSAAFIAAALANTGLINRLAGLTAYVDAFHLRPGVEIDSATATAGLVISGDLNLADFRYASRNPNAQVTGVYGSGEPGALVIRAGGNLSIYGSITDGFDAPADGNTTLNDGTTVTATAVNPDDNGWILKAGVNAFGEDFVVPVGMPQLNNQPITLASGTTYTSGTVTLNYAVTLSGGILVAGVPIPTAVTLAAALTLPAGTRLAAAITDASGNVLLAANSIVQQATTVPGGSIVTAGSILPVSATIGTVSWPAGASLAAFGAGQTLTLAAAVPLAAGDLIPAGTNVVFSSGARQMLTRAEGAGGSITYGTNGAQSAMIQGSIWADAAMLADGPSGQVPLSWSMAFVSGGDTAAADPHTLLTSSALAAQATARNSNPGSMILSDPHYQVALTRSGNVFSYYPSFSVIRTGTGDLTLLSGGGFSEESLYGIYTAGAQSPAVVGPKQAGTASTSTTVPAGYDAAIDAYQAYDPVGGGNVVLAAQGNLTGDTFDGNASDDLLPSNAVGNWLWWQGNSTIPTAWWINFGSYVLPLGPIGARLSNNTTVTDGHPLLVGFTGIGALGGGNVTVNAGGDAGAVAGLVSATGRGARAWTSRSPAPAPSTARR